MIRVPKNRESPGLSKFDRLIDALCQEHYDCVRHAEGPLSQRRELERPTVGSRLSGVIISDMEIRPQSSLNLSMSTGTSNLNIGRQPSERVGRRHVSYLQSGAMSASSQEISSRVDVSESIKPSDPQTKSSGGPNRGEDDTADRSFAVVQSEDDELAVDVSFLRSSSAFDSELSMHTASIHGSRQLSRKLFEVRQLWKEQDWVVRPSDGTEFCTISEHPGYLSNEISVDGEHGNRFKNVGDAFVHHPNSRKRLAWNMMCFVLIVYDIIVVPLQAFTIEDFHILKVADWIVRFIWTIDIPISCFAGFYFKGHLHMSFRETRHRYFVTWFPLDLVLVGCDWVLYFVTAESSYGKIIRFLRILRMLRLLRLVKLRGILAALEDVINTQNIAIYFRCLKPLFAVALLTHVLACGWFGVGCWDLDYDHSWITATNVLERSRGYQYATSLHWSLAQFTLNTMDVYARNLGERLYTIAVGLFGIIGFSVLVSGFTSAAEQLREIKSDETKQFWMLRRFIKDYAISHKLAHRIVRYCEYAYLDQKAHIQPEDVTLMKLLSEQLRIEMSMEIYSPLLTPHPLFLRMEFLRHRSLRHICYHLSPCSYARGDSFVTKGEDSTGMMMLTEGEASYTYSEKMCTNSQRLEPGQWICEPSLWTYWTAVGNAKAMVHSRVLVIYADVLEKVFSFAPVNEWMYVQRHAQKFVAHLNSLPRDALNDLVEPILPSEGTINGNPQKDMGSVAGFVQKLTRRISSVRRVTLPRLSCDDSQRSSGTSRGSTSVRSKCEDPGSQEGMQEEDQAQLEEDENNNPEFPELRGSNAPRSSLKTSTSFHSSASRGSQRQRKSAHFRYPAPCRICL